MWFLEHESLFGGKRIWLRPGSQQLFGRTKHSDEDQTEGKKVFIDNKLVSRKHMMIKVLEVPPENGTKLHARSCLEITDLSCRQGTIVDGGQPLKSTKEADGTITYDKTTLAGTEHTIKLSNSYPPFKVRWQDVVFTYASKEKRESEKSKARNAELHAIDIKTTTEFVYDKTTHVVSQKRNLPKVLQGLVSGTPIVTTEYLDAILNAAKHSSSEEGNYVPSKLEEDFDTWWPKEKEYIPPVGAEPVPRPDQMLEPDPSRSEVFTGLTFIFLNESQYSSLHGAIAGGGGKALLFDIQPGETTAEEYVDYVRNAAGQKRRSKAGNGGLPVVTIRLSAYPDGMEDWAADFVTGVDRELNQRSILQNEFLDAIVTKDTSSLRRPPAEIMEADSSMPSGTRTQRSMREPTPTSRSRGLSQAPEASLAPKEEPARTIPRKRPIRRGVTTRFTGFDDYEPPSKTRKIEDTSMADMPESMSIQDPQSQSIAAAQTQHTQQSPVEESVETAAQMDQLFPAAAAIRKQRAATRAASASVEPENQACANKTKSKGEELLAKMQKLKKKADKVVDIREEARKRVKEEEDRRRADEESLREALEGVDISEIRAAVQVEEMELRPQQDRPSSRSQAQSDRWNPEWNGRKNFKKFRRRGAERGPQSQKVLVTFEEAPQKKGFGDAFFLEDTEPPVRTKEDERRLKRRIGRGQDSDSEREPGFTRRKRTKHTEVINVAESGPDDEEIPGESLSSHRNSGRTQRVAETQLDDPDTQKGTRKRGPVSVAAGQPSRKRNRASRRDDDSDEEETGFRFRRRG
ncbi:DNA damage response protein RcaA [Trematosphaeria pertusa]|uniref:DNA damage response protein RcaA n=1 Tax=Trematosphaeria pertusa TaxID=390896 RepID=A0A6A6IZI6_9PLEO|nr:DNA damage response protein RcaA [Trematosphaeria pertusa]KAF2255000.1 DNA damage response protein RcaA [Trematosphaeria pertusa]